MAKPGRGWAALLVTREGSHYGMTSSLRGFTAQVDGIGAVWFRPSSLQAPHISGGISTPLSRVNVYGQCDLVAANADWWIADHLYEDQFAGAEVTVYRETAGTLGAVMFSGYVLDKRGVQADGTRVTFSCTSILGYFLPEKTVGGRETLNLDTFPNLEPPPVVALTLDAEDGATADQIARIGIATNHGFARSFAYAGAWPLGPFPVSGLDAGSTTFTVVARDADLVIIYTKQVTTTVPSSGTVLLWIAPEDVDAGEAPSTISNPDEGATIPVFFGQYREQKYFVPCMVYDWMQANGNLCKYVYEDLANIDGDALRSITAGNNDVILIDTQPPQSTTDEDGNEVPIKFPRTFIDVKTTIAEGEAYYIRRDGDDVVPNLITWHAPGGPGGLFGTFDLRVDILNAWMRVIRNDDTWEFDPLRFKILTQAGGARTDNTEVMDAFHAAGASPDHHRAMSSIIRLLVDHARVPPSKIDLDTAIALQDEGTARARRYLTSGESVETAYAALCQDARLLSYERDGKVTWKRNSVTAPPPAVFQFDEARCVAGSMAVASNDWGPYFNAASGVTQQGFPYDDESGRVTVAEVKNAAAIEANDGVKVSTSIEFAWLHEKDDMRSCIAEALDVAGLPSHTYSATVSAFEPGDDPSTDDLDAQLSVVAGDTIQSGYIASRRDPDVRRLISRGSNAMCIGFDHDPETGLSTLTFWRFGFAAATGQSVMMVMSGTEEFPSELGGGVIDEVWDSGWTDAQKAYAANYGSGIGGWISETDTQIDASDTSLYNTSYMR